MAKNEQMLRLKFIEDLLRRKKNIGASYEEIKKYLEEKFADKDLADELKFTERTFQRDKKAILEVFGIEISYSRKNNCYYINEEELEIAEESIYDSLLLVEAYRETKDRSDIMFFEPRKSKGLDLLHGLIHAIVHKKVLSFTYQKFWTDEMFSRVVQPYALKEFKHRWYLLAKEFNSKDEKILIKSYGLDRITNLEIKNTTFSKEKYDPEEEYRNSFGIISPDGQEPQEIILAFDQHQGNYVKALPIHHSQKIISDSPEETVIKLFLIPTYDFEREILSYGERVRIIEPLNFRKKMRNEVQNMLRKLN